MVFIFHYMGSTVTSSALLKKGIKETYIFRFPPTFCISVPGMDLALRGTHTGQYPTVHSTG